MKTNILVKHKVTEVKCQIKEIEIISNISQLVFLFIKSRVVVIFVKQTRDKLLIQLCIFSVDSNKYELFNKHLRIISPLSFIPGPVAYILCSVEDV